MSIWNQASNYGVIKVDGKKLKVYRSSQEFQIINVNEDINNAHWAGDAIVVSLSNGKVRRYRSYQEYTTI